jgi:hypothetical protein
MSDFYVYLHRKATTGEVFYVGKGKTRRAYDRFGRSKWWQRTVAKHGLIVEICDRNLQEWYAFERESELIAYYGRSDLGYGCLINCTDGGEGSAGNLQSEKTRRLRALSNTGQKRSDEIRLKLKRAQQKYIAETPDAIDKKRKEHSHEMKKVVRSDGVVFESVHAAGKAMTDIGYSKTSYSHISACCNGHRPKAFGFTWRFKNDDT